MSRTSPLESCAVVEENGISQDPATGPGGGQASLGVSGDKPCGEKAQEAAVEDSKATATCSVTTAAATSNMPAAQVNDKVKWSPDQADKYLQSLKMSISNEESTVQIGTAGDAVKGSGGGGGMVVSQEKSRISKHPTPSVPGGGSPINKMRLGHGGGYGSVGHTVTTGGGLGGGAGGRSRGGGAGPISAAATGGGGGGGGGGSLQCYKLVQVPGQQLFYPQQAGPAAMHVSQGLHPGHSRQTSLSPMTEQVSSTNLYIRGLSKEYSDEDLVKLCKRFGTIISTKAILDKNTTLCRGYGFVDFENPGDAQQAVATLQAEGILAQFAKLPQQEQDPTNLYFSGLPRDYDEKMLENLVKQYGRIVSSRVIRNNSGNSKGVGFCRMENREDCKKVIEVLDKAKLPGNSESITVKFADSGSSRRKLNRWKDFQEIQPYMYEAPPHLVPPNGVLGARGFPQGMLAPPYMTGAQVHGYQVPGVSSHNWQSPAYYMQPANTIPGGGQVESVLTAQMGQLQISGTGYSHQQHPAQFHIPPSQYGGGGWALSHATPSGLPHGQEHSTEHHGSGEIKSHHIQVISSGNSEHNDDSAHGPKAPVHMYYPNTV